MTAVTRAVAARVAVPACRAGQPRSSPFLARMASCSAGGSSVFRVSTCPPCSLPRHPV